jgi:hypothetical protein
MANAYPKAEEDTIAKITEAMIQRLLIRKLSVRHIKPALYFLNRSVSMSPPSVSAPDLEAYQEVFLEDAPIHPDRLEVYFKNVPHVALHP